MCNSRPRTCDEARKTAASHFPCPAGSGNGATRQAPRQASGTTPMKSVHVPHGRPDVWISERTESMRRPDGRFAAAQAGMYNRAHVPQVRRSSVDDRGTFPGGPACVRQTVRPHPSRPRSRRRARPVSHTVQPAMRATEGGEQARVRGQVVMANGQKAFFRTVRVTRGHAVKQTGSCRAKSMRACWRT